MEVRVEAVPAAATFLLRQRVLRAHEELGQLALPGDDDPDTCHVAALTASGEVVSTANVRREPPPWEPNANDGWRLRGMATSEQLRGRGLGTRLLDAALAHVATRGGGLVWCNARLPAQRCYDRGGFATRGEPWNDPDLGPHVVMWRYVEREVPRGTSPDDGTK
jgi:predicted GNAT family N-acyltransferase